MRRHEEVLCKNVFNAYLLRHARQADVVWTDVPERCDPPDFFLDYLGTTYAVEVTSLMEHATNNQADSMSLFDILFEFKGLVAQVEASALGDGLLRGCYGVAFAGSLGDWSKTFPRTPRRPRSSGSSARPLTSRSKVRSELKRGMLAYIRATASLSTAPEEYVYRKHLQWCSIRKLCAEPDAVRSVWTSELVLVQGIGSVTAGLIHRIVQTKTQKLQKIASPKILLIHDMYGYGSDGLASQETRQACRSHMPAPSSFHAVFIVHDADHGSTLWSQDPRWSEAADTC